MAATMPEDGAARMTSASPNEPRDSTADSLRRRSFSFLRKSPSKDAVQTTSPSSSFGRKLTKRRKKSQSAVPPLAPRLPSYQLLPNISAPLPSNIPPPPQQQLLQQQQPQQQFSSPSQSGFHRPLNYNPSAFYQRNMDSSRSTPPGSQHSPPPSRNTSHGFDPHARTESMTNRGRYSYASQATFHSDSPRRMRRRKDPTPFNVLVVGTKNCGKTSFINFLRTALSTPIKLRPSTPSPPPPTARNDSFGSFTSQYLETELQGERVGLTLYDSKGLERHLVDLQLREMSAFLEEKFQETFAEEQKVMRATGVRDTHIHCVLLLLDPTRLDANVAAALPKPNEFKENVYSAKPRFYGNLDEALDIEVIRTLEGKTTVIPVISKADTVTTAHMAFLKRSVWSSLKQVGFDPLTSLNLESDGESEDESHESVLEEEDEAPAIDASKAINGDGNLAPKHNDFRMSSLSMNVDLPDLPMSLISPDMHDPGTTGRRFPWGFADPYNPEHCDFVRLKDAVFKDWRAALRVASRERWYEGWRTTRLKKRTLSPGSLDTKPPGTGADGQRSISGAAAYGATASKSPTNGPVHPRAVSASNIGLALSDPPNGNAK